MKLKLAILLSVAFLGTLAILGIYSDRLWVSVENHVPAMAEAQPDTNNVPASPAVTNQTDFDAVAPETEAALNKLGFTAKGTSPIGVRVVLQK